MLKRKLGRSNIKVSALGLGGWAMGGTFNRLTEDGEMYPMGWGKVDDNESISSIHAALDLGVNFIDTANNYGAGHSESVLGKALKNRRDKVVIATKFGSVFDEAKKIHYDKGQDFIISPAFIRSACEESLRRLQTDYIDLYQFHLGTYNEDQALDVRATLDELVDEGKIRAFGWSTDHPHLAAIFAESENCTAVQHRLNILNRADNMLTLCEEHDLASINKSPLNSAFLTGKFHKNYTFAKDDGRRGFDWELEIFQKRLAQVEALREILTSDGRTMAQGALAWIWAHSPRTIPIPGFKNMKQVEENVGALQYGPLSAEQVAEIERLIE